MATTGTLGGGSENVDAATGAGVARVAGDSWPGGNANDGTTAGAAVAGVEPAATGGVVPTSGRGSRNAVIIGTAGVAGDVVASLEAETSGR